MWLIIFRNQVMTSSRILLNKTTLAINLNVIQSIYVEKLDDRNKTAANFFKTGVYTWYFRVKTKKKCEIHVPNSNPIKIYLKFDSSSKY